MSQFGYKDAVEYYGESFGKVKADGTHHILSSTVLDISF